MFSLCTGISLYLPIILPLVSTCLLYALLFPYIFLLFDCFKWVLIDHIEKCRGHSVLWQFQMGGSISFTWVNLKIWAHLLLFPYIFLLFDCLEWVLIDRIEKHRGHSALWQFRIGGGSNGRFTLNLPILSSLAVSCFASQKVFSYYIRKT